MGRRREAARPRPRRPRTEPRPASASASAGPIDLPNGTVSPINITEWQQFPIVERVSDVTRLPVRLGGDGLCMALGEQWCGAGRGAQFLLGMVVSTGVGGGLVLDGAPYDGRTGNAGHVGHVVVAPDGGELRTCGGRRLRRNHRVGAEHGAVGPQAGLGRYRTPRRWVMRQIEEMIWAIKAFQRGARGGRGHGRVGGRGAATWTWW